MQPSGPSQPDPVGQTLSELCAQAAGGDDAAFARLHDRLDNGLRRFLSRRAGQRHDIIDELSQRAWLGVWEALRNGRYDPSRAAITTFLYGVGYKLWLQQVRGTRGTASDNELDSLAESLFGLTDPAEFLRKCELLDAVRAFVHEVSPPAGPSDEERAVLRGVMAGRSERELAQSLALAPSTVNSRKHSSFKKLRDYLIDCGLAEPAFGPASKSTHGANNQVASEVLDSVTARWSTSP